MSFYIKADRKICRQLQSRFSAVQIKQSGSKVNHISIRLTAETVKAPVNFHAGVLVRMEGADAHPVSAHPDSVNLCSLSCGDRLLDRFKYIQNFHLQT